MTQVTARPSNMQVAIRTFVDPGNPEDLKAANTIQDKIIARQSSLGSFDIPDWDDASRKRVGDGLKLRGSTLPDSERVFGDVGDKAGIIFSASIARARRFSTAHGRLLWRSRFGRRASTRTGKRPMTHPNVDWFSPFAWLAAAALVLLMGATRAQGASVGIEGTAWLVEDIAGQGVIDRAQTTISFDTSGRASGSTGCNRFTGAATIEREALSFGQLATTKRACVPALMDQEQKFLRALEGVRGYAVDANGLLQLKGANGEPLLRLAHMAVASTRVTGTVSYRERIALAPGSLVIVTLEDTSKADAKATMLGEARITIERNQVPIAFAIEVEPGRIDPRHRYAVRARILDPQGALRWTSTQAYLVITDGHPSSVDVRVEAIRSPVAAPPPSQVLVFVCDEGEFRVRMSMDQVELVLPDRTLVLPQVAAASGAKYQEGRTVFWNKGNEARFEIDGKVYLACIRRPG
jgi:putative lipoprotein